MANCDLKLLLDYPQAADALSMSRAALRDLVYKGRGPVVTRIGRRTYFAIQDLEAFVAAHREPALTLPPESGTSHSQYRGRGRPPLSDRNL